MYPQILKMKHQTILIIKVFPFNLPLIIYSAAYLGTILKTLDISFKLSNAMQSENSGIKCRTLVSFLENQPEIQFPVASNCFKISKRRFKEYDDFLKNLNSVILCNLPIPPLQYFFQNFFIIYIVDHHWHLELIINLRIELIHSVLLSQAISLKGYGSQIREQMSGPEIS